MNQEEKWLKWAMEIQAIAQNGLWYGKDEFDKERYTRLRELSVEILSEYTEVSKEKVYVYFAIEKCREMQLKMQRFATHLIPFRQCVGQSIALAMKRDDMGVMN